MAEFCCKICGNGLITPTNEEFLYAHCYQGTTSVLCRNCNQHYYCEDLLTFPEVVARILEALQENKIKILELRVKALEATINNSKS